MASRDIKYIVVHCTAGSQKSTAPSVMKIFRERGWKNPGYHYLVTLEGKVHNLLSEWRVANGVRGYNSYSIHVSYTGGVNQKDLRTPEDTRTDMQKVGLIYILQQLKHKYPKAQILGHRDFPGVSKKCPSFNVREEYGTDFCNPWPDGMTYSPKDFVDKDYSVPEHLTASPWG